MKAILRTTICATLALAAFESQAQSAHAHEQKVSAAAEGQTLAAALDEWAERNDFKLVAKNWAVAEGLVAPKLSDSLQPKEELEHLLADSPLTYRWLSDRVVAVRARPGADIRLAQADQARPTPTKPQGAAQREAADRPASRMPRMEEIIVTAQKRAESLQDVPLSLAVISSDDVDRRGLVSAEDYLRGVPGANQVDSNFGPSVVIRGLETTTVSQNFASGSTVAMYFGETLTTRSAGITGGSGADLKLVDIERIEVLRGPQGTSFGDSSLGGAVRTIPVAPQLERAEGGVKAGYSTTSGGGGDNTMMQAVGNIPLGDRVALRATAYRFEDSGYYRNVAGTDPTIQAAAATFGAQAYARNEEDIGNSEFTGGRIAALFQTGENSKLTLTYATQDTRVDGWVGVNRGGFDQALFNVGPAGFVHGHDRGGNDTDIDLANALFEYDMGWANLVATYSHVEGGSTWSIPWSAFGVIRPVTTASLSDHKEQTAEVRVSTQFDGAWNFLAGVYAEKVEDLWRQTVIWYGDLATNPYAPNQRIINVDNNPLELKQKAAFGEVSWEFAPSFTLTGGARVYDYERTFRQQAAGALTGTVSRAGGNDASDVNFRGNLSYKPSEEMMLYAGWAQGFRLGKPQQGVPAALCDPGGDGTIDGTGITVASTRQLSSDSVDSYEIGGKFVLAEGRIMVSGDVFRAEWTEIPVQARVTCGGALFGYTTNAGDAISKGVEAQAALQITDGFRIDVGASYIDAHLTKDVPVQGFRSGDRLPSPEVNANLGLEYTFDVAGYRTSLRTDSTYVGDFNSRLPGTPANEAGGYVKIDASARVSIGSLNVDLYVHNLTDADDITLAPVPYPFLRMRPRTVGVQLGYDF